MEFDYPCPGHRFDPHSRLQKAAQKFVVQKQIQFIQINWFLHLWYWFEELIIHQKIFHFLLILSLVLQYDDDDDDSAFFDQTLIIWMISLLYFKLLQHLFQDNPVTTTVSTTALPIEKVAFPAITICGQGLVREIVEKVTFNYFRWVKLILWSPPDVIIPFGLLILPPQSHKFLRW